MASPTEPRTRIAALDGLRALAALSVLGLHVWQASGTPRLDTPVGPFLTTLLAAGNVGVDFFFVLSGFVLFLPTCLNGGRFGSVPDYFLRRAARILPLYWVTLLVVVLGLRFFTAEPQASLHMGTNLFLHLTFLAHPIASLVGLLEGFGVNGAVWTLSLEVAFYLVLPLVAAQFYRRPELWFGIFVIVSFLWRFGVTAAVNPESMAGPTVVGIALTAALPTYLTHFALGMAAARLFVWLKPEEPRRDMELAALWVLSFGALGLVWGTHEVGVAAIQGTATPYSQFTGTLPVTIAFTCVLLGLLLGPSWTRRLVDNDVLRIGGEISYGIYLWHLIVIGLLAMNVPLPTGGTRHFVLWLGLVLPTTLALAWCSHVAIERPAVQWARRRTAPSPHEDDSRGPEFPEHHLDPRWLYGAFAVYAVLLAILLLSPEPLENVFGVNLKQLAHSTEEITNVLVFVPIGLVGAARLPRRWQALLLGVGLACLVELAQYAWLPDRTPSFDDVLKNSLGTAIGVLLYRPRRPPLPSVE